MKQFQVFLMLVTVSFINCATEQLKIEIRESPPNGKKIITVNGVLPLPDHLFGPKDWSNKWEICPKDMKATGFVLKNAPYEGSTNDDTSVTGIGLLCGDDGAYRITSLFNPQSGVWGNATKCRKNFFLTAFRLAFDATNPNKRGNGDSIGVDNVEFSCSHVSDPSFNNYALQEDAPSNSRRKVLKEVYRESLTMWSERCTTGICGINTWVDVKHKAIFMVDDRSGLVNVRFSCC